MVKMVSTVMYKSCLFCAVTLSCVSDSTRKADDLTFLQSDCSLIGSSQH